MAVLLMLERSKVDVQRLALALAAAYRASFSPDSGAIDRVARGRGLAMTRRAMRLLLLLLVPPLLADAALAEGTDYQLERGASVFAIVTHRGGLAAALGHNHLIVAKAYSAQLSVQGLRPPQAAFRLRVPVSALAPADPRTAARLAPELKRLGLIEDGFPQLSEPNTRALLENLRSADQLDAQRYPEIAAVLRGLRAAPQQLGGRRFAYTLELDLSVHGHTVPVHMAASIARDGERLHLFAVGEARFRQFGIEPYQAAFGALKVPDRFQLVASLYARPSP